MFPLAIFGIESSGLNLAIDLLILFVVVLYLSLIYWTYSDARRRILDPMLVGCATLASFFPFVGTIIYVILRPPEYLEDVRERELELQAAEARVHELDEHLCPHCHYRVERDFVRCPSCLAKLKERCVGCQRPLDQEWAICPYCETEVPGAIPPARRRRRRRRSTDESVRIEEEPAPARDEPARLQDEPPPIDDRSALAPTSSWPPPGEDPDLTLPAITPAAADEEDAPRAKPVAAPEPASARARSARREDPRPRRAGPARRTRPTS